MQSPYFELAGRFWVEDEKSPLSPWATRLYFRLLHEANKNFWRGPLHLTWTYLLGVMGLKSRDTLSKAISDLKSRELIVYGKEGKKAVFWFPKLDQSSIRTNQGGSVLYTDRSSIRTNHQSSIRTVPSNFTKSVLYTDSNPDQKTDRFTDRSPDYINKKTFNTLRQKDREGNNISSTPSGVLKDPILQNGTLPIECRGIPCGKIVELYSFYFGKPMRISSYIAKLIRERHTENPELDWKSFLQFVAEKNRQLTLTQILTSRNFYTLLKEFREIQEFDEKLERARKRAELEERRMGGIAHIGNLLGRRNHADGDLR